MGNICAGGIGSSHARTNYDDHVHTMPPRQAPATPMADQSPLGGLPPRSPRGAGPSRPRTELPNWEKSIRQSVHDMAHEVFNLTSPILDELDEKAQRDVVTVLGKMLDRVRGNSAAGGGDDFVRRMQRIQGCVQRIQDQVGSRPAQRPASLVEADGDSPVLNQMRQLVNSIDLALMAAKAGGDVRLMELVPSPFIKRAVAQTVSNMASGYETGFDPLPEGLGVRIQNLVGQLSRGERVPRGVANAVADSNNNPDALLAKLRTLVAQYPDLGKDRNVQDYR